MLYDGDCPICQAEVRRLTQWNKGGDLVFEDISANTFSFDKYSKTYDQLMGRIHGVYPDGRIISGIEVFQQSYAAVGKGWLLAPTQWPVLDRIFEYLYLHFARHRVALGRWYGRCNSELPLKNYLNKGEDIMLTNPKPTYHIDRAAVITVLVAFGCFLVLAIAAAMRQSNDLIGVFTSMNTTSLLLISVALVHVCFRFRKLYWVQERPCASEEEACAVRKMKRNQRVMFWLGGC